MAKVLHVPFTYYPDPIGGTEVYVESLARELKPLGYHSVIAAPSSSGSDEEYVIQGIRVHRFRGSKSSKNLVQELYGDGDEAAGTAFERILHCERPDLLHLHAFTRSVSIHLLRAARKRLIPVIFTYHTPTVSCQRGTLMRWGEYVCDGVVEPRRCAACCLQEEGIPKALSYSVSQTPYFIDDMLQSVGLSGAPWRLFRMPGLLERRRRAFLTLMREVDAIIALRGWTRTVLIGNGISRSKIKLCEHGLVGTGHYSLGAAAASDCESLRVAFFGRADRTKGIDTLIKAMKAAPEAKIEVDLYGIVQSGDAQYLELLQRLARDDRRLKFLPAIAHDQVVETLRTYHYLAVPSRWMETGPLVVLEAFAAGTPVIGSDIGGIAELVQHERNGLLVQFDDVRGWTDTLRRCAADRSLLVRLRAGIGKPRMMMDVAREIASIYQETTSQGPQLTNGRSDQLQSSLEV
jgi:glycosyltransferase involved in cell wall biosynthesis